MLKRTRLLLLLCLSVVMPGITAEAEIIESSMSAAKNIVYIEGRANQEYAGRDISLIITNNETGEIINLAQIKTDNTAGYSYKFATETDLTSGGYTLKVFNGKNDLSYGVISAMQETTSVEASVTINSGDGDLLLEWIDKYGASHGEDFKLAVAYYDENDRLLRVQTKDYTVDSFQAGSDTIYLDPPSADAKYLKAFAWTTQLKPVMECVEHELDHNDFGFRNIVTTFKGDAKTSRGFAWTANTSREDMVIRYAKKSDEWESSYTEIAADKERYADRLYYKADLTGLESGTEYVYVIGDTEDDVWGESYSFTTEADDGSEFSFIAIADPQGDKQYTYSLMDELVDSAGDKCPYAKFMLSLGDMVELGYKEEYWDMYFDALSGYCTNIPNMAIIGNHEARDNAGLHFRLHFNNDDSAAESIHNNISSSDLTDIYSKSLLENIEGSVYSFDYGDVHIAALNTGSDWHTANTLKLAAAQTEWLEEDLKSSDAKWKIVMLHQGLYPIVESRYFGLRDVFESIIQDYGVDLVLQGHDHMVGRTYPMKNGAIVSEDTPESVNKGEGIIYHVPGSAGDKRYGNTAKPSYMATLLNTNASKPTYSVFDVSDEKLSVETYQIDGVMVDSFEIVAK